MRTEYPIDVIVNIYDLAGINSLLHPAGFGIYHTGLEVDGKEFTFSESGVFYHTPKAAGDNSAPGQTIILRESIKIGTFVGNRNSVQQRVDNLRDDFPGSSYHLVLKNCNHFSEALCQSLLPNVPFPSFINRIAYVGSLFSCMFSYAGSPATPKLKTEPPVKFQGAGNTLGKTTASSTAVSVNDIRTARFRKLLKENK